MGLPTHGAGGRVARVRRAAAELSPEAIEKIAQRVVQLLRQDGRHPVEGSVAHAGLLSAGQLAQHLGLTRAWVYQHAEKLGAIRVGTGPCARLRFDLARATEALDSEDAVRTHYSSRPRTNRKPQPRRERQSDSPVPLLPINPPRVRGAFSRVPIPLAMKAVGR